MEYRTWQPDEKNAPTALEQISRPGRVSIFGGLIAPVCAPGGFPVNAALGKREGEMDGGIQGVGSRLPIPSTVITNQCSTA